MMMRNNQIEMEMEMEMEMGVVPILLILPDKSNTI